MAAAGSEERSPLTIIWRIENIKLVYDIPGLESVISPILRPCTFGRKKFLLYFYSKGKNGNNNCVSLGIKLCDEPLDFPIDCKWSFVSCNGLKLGGGIVRNQVMSKTAFDFTDCPTQEEVFVTRKSEFFLHDTLTVRFHIWKSGENLLNEEFLSCRTRLSTLEHSFHWPISRFRELDLNKEVTIPITFGDSRSRDNFLMKFLLKGVSLDDSIANVELIPVSLFQSYIVTLKLSILNEDRKKNYWERGPTSFVEDGKKTLTFLDFVSRKEVLEKESDCLENDVLTICCEITTIRFITIIEKCFYGFPKVELDILENATHRLDASCQTMEQNVDFTEILLQEKSSFAFLTEDLLSMYKEENLSDFKLSSGDISFSVHKNILSARSPVFKAMFSSNMDESCSGSLEVSDLDPHTMNRMLTYLYTGTLEHDLERQSAAKLYYAADKYQIESLKQHCSCILRSNISVSNVSDILSLADRHQDKDLTSFVHNFFLCHFDEIMQSEEWESFMNSDSVLYGKTVHQLYKRKLQLKRP